MLFTFIINFVGIEQSVENAPNPQIGLGHDPEGFFEEEMVGRIWLK